MTTILPAKLIEARTLTRLADWSAVGVAVSLPWSTSASGILIVVWLAAALVTLDVAAVRRELASAAGGLPILLWALAAIGMLWADVSWSERFHGLGGFNRLLVIPFLLAQFRRSEHGMWVFLGFFASALGVLLFSWVLVLIPGLPWSANTAGVPVKDYIIQSEIFLVSGFVLLGCAFDVWRKMPGLALGFIALALVFFANIVFVASSRTVILVAPALALLLGWRQLGWKGLFGAGLLGCMVGVAIWYSSPYLRERLETSIAELQAYREKDEANSTSLHLEFLKKSLSFVETAPIIGHGTGSIEEQFRKAAIGETGSAAATSVNPHNQIFAVAIQIGLVGAAVLLAMWIAHGMLFRGTGLAAWIGTVVVVENFLASLLNSHLFDFSQGWLYVFGVGVAGGMRLRERDSAQAARGGAG